MAALGGDQPGSLRSLEVRSDLLVRPTLQQCGQSACRLPTPAIEIRSATSKPHFKKPLIAIGNLLQILDEPPDRARADVA